ncbi:MAG: ROK family protein [Clostridia bacterium]|nr:ROK family protein [Clostridia bacterium]
MIYAGVDVGGMSIKCCLATEQGEILVKDSFKTKDGITSAEMGESIARFLKELASRIGVAEKEIRAVGIGTPGTVDGKKGVIVYSNNIKLEHAPIVQDVRKHLDCPVFVENDANAAALGEALFGAAKGLSNVLLVTLGTGVGTGIVANGEMITGVGGAGAEGGHIMLKMGGERCTCGNRGCFEAYASASALLRQTARMVARRPDSLLASLWKEKGESGIVPFDAAKAGDKAGLKVIKDYVSYVAQGLASLANIFRPDVVLIGGGISNQGDYFIKKVSRKMNALLYGAGVNPKVKVLAAALKNDAGLYGALALAIKGERL